MDNFLTDYIKAIENPNKVGWNGKVWTAPNLKGYDPNQRGYGIDIRYNNSAKVLTKNRKGQWLTDSEATNLMNDHLNYLKGVALRKIKGFDNFSPKKQAIILGMLYRGDSVLSNVDVNEQDDTKFMNSVHNYYISKGLNERAKNSSNFFNKQQQKRNIVPNFTIPNTNYVLLPDNLRVLKPMIFLQGGLFSMLANSPAKEWGNDWKRRNQSSKVLRLWTGKEKPKRDWKKEEQERIQKQTIPLRTWRSDVADTLHGIGEGVLALNPYTAIPYYGAKVGLDFLNGTYGWHTALNASVPLFHMAPQTVGLREATNVALEDAANLGSKIVRNWRIAREINLATKNKPNIEIPNPTLYNINDNITLYRADASTPKGRIGVEGDSKGRFVGTWFTNDPNKPHWYAANYTKRGETPLFYQTTVPKYWAEKLRAIYKVPRNIDFEPEDFILEDGVKGLSGLSYVGKPGTLSFLLQSFNIPRSSYPKTSLKFFERNPSRISEAERLGIPRGDRGNLSLNLKLAIEDLALYKNSGQYRQIFRVTPDWKDFGWNLDKNNPTFIQQAAKDGKPMRGSFVRVPVLTPSGKGILSWNPEKNMGSYSSKTFKQPLELKYSPGEANMMLDGSNHKIILTSPRVDIQDFMDDLANGTIEDLNLFKSLDSQLKRTIDKDVMKDFWINSRKVQRPGSYLSGDNGHAPLGSTLIEAFKKKQLHKTPVLERPISSLFITRTGLSPDSYSSIIRQGNRDGSLRWGEGFIKWNNSAVENKFINNAFELFKRGEITPELYEDVFNKWSSDIGGRPLLWTTIGDKKVPVHPHPYIYAKKQGGKVIQQFKNRKK